MAFFEQPDVSALVPPTSFPLWSPQPATGTKAFEAIAGDLYEGEDPDSLEFSKKVIPKFLEIFKLLYTDKNASKHDDLGTVYDARSDQGMVEYVEKDLSAGFGKFKNPQGQYFAYHQMLTNSALNLNASLGSLGKWAQDLAKPIMYDVNEKDENGNEIVIPKKDSPDSWWFHPGAAGWDGDNKELATELGFQQISLGGDNLIEAAWNNNPALGTPAGFIAYVRLVYNVMQNIVGVYRYIWGSHANLVNVTLDQDYYGNSGIKIASAGDTVLSPSNFALWNNNSGSLGSSSYSLLSNTNSIYDWSQRAVALPQVEVNKIHAYRKLLLELLSTKTEEIGNTWYESAYQQDTAVTPAGNHDIASYNGYTIKYGVRTNLASLISQLEVWEYVYDSDSGQWVKTGNRGRDYSKAQNLLALAGMFGLTVTFSDLHGETQDLSSSANPDSPFNQINKFRAFNSGYYPEFNEELIMYKWVEILNKQGYVEYLKFTMGEFGKSDLIGGMIREDNNDREEAYLKAKETAEEDEARDESKSFSRLQEQIDAEQGLAEKWAARNRETQALIDRLAAKNAGDRRASAKK